MLQAQNRFEMMREYWRERFLETDQARLIEQFHLAADDQYIYIVYYEQRYAVNRSNGFISLCDDPGVEIPFGPLMSIYHLFCYSKPGAMNSGRFVPFRQVRGASPFAPAFEKSIAEE